MAGGKLSPRQKMINLMYLVFLAMIALNMGKQVLDAFGLVNQKFEVSNRRDTQGISSAMEQLALKASESPAQFAQINEQSKQIKTISDDLYNYVQGLKDGLLIYEVDRFDVKGKALLQRNAKYYVVDSAFRKFLLSRTDSDRGHILENIVYLELIRRGYRVYVGHLQNGEIDFVAKKPHRLEYYQVSYTVMEDTTLRRELSPLEQLDDNYPKYLLTMDVLHKTDNHNGIEQKNVLDWLLE